MDFQKVLQEVARQNNTTPEAMYREMQQTIDETFRHPNAFARRLWPHKNKPTPEQFLRALLRQTGQLPSTMDDDDPA